MAPIKTNNPYASYFDFFSRTGTDAVTPEPPPVSGLTATGGVISDYEDSGTYYRAHIFNASGALNVQSVGTLPASIDYLVIGGGGGGAAYQGGGGGAGGFRTNVPGTPHSTSTAFTAVAAAYPIVIGAGGNGGTYVAPSTNSPGSDGVDTSFGPPSSPARIISSGGGAGVGYPVGGTGHPAGNAGGSGGGAGRGGTPYVATGNGGATESITGLPVSPTTQGHAGGTGGSNGNPVGNSNHSYGGGGGGGAGAVGGNATLPNAGPASVGGAGGAGLQLAIAGPAANTTGVGALNPGPGQYQWFAGGGSGASGKQGNANGTVVDGGVGGGGVGGRASSVTPAVLHNATISTGSGGGGAASPSTPAAGSGGSGIVIVRYQIIQNQSSSAKATGGAISFYGGKTIHAFTGSGTFATTSGWSAADVEYVVIGGGGGGGGNGGVNGAGGGGAGTYRTGSTPIGAHPVSTSIQVGAGGVGGQWPATKKGATGTSSYFGTPITSPGGGGGGSYTGYHPGDPGGSSGGSGVRGDGSSSPTTPVASATGASFPGTIGATPSVGWGHQGGAGSGDTANRQGGGGGGAGGAGAAGTNSSPYYGEGGIGIQMPATFRDPVQNYGAPGPTSPSVTGADTSGKYYVAGGGAGSNGPNASVSGGAGGGGPFSTGLFAQNGAANTGGGGSGSGSPSRLGGTGGDGLVLIAYPT
ncbi:hypothetical protein N9991_00015 [bacterium]|nr:hypothetical protein [bacterium]